MRTRFAPSPTGALHMGHLASALWVWAGARKFQCEIILRIEDHDRQRCKPGYESAMIRDLEALGFSWDLGPGASPSLFRQSDREEFYQNILQEWEKQGLVYGCKCTRSQLQSLRSLSGEIIYAGECRHSPLQSGTSTRLFVPESHSSTWTDLWKGQVQGQTHQEAGDFVIRDRLGLWTYQFCCSVDDRAQGIDLIIRGQDLWGSTLRQVYIHQLRGLSKPLLFGHHPLICDEQGRKLAKRDGDLSLRQMLDQGFHPEQLIARALEQMGIIPNEKGIPLEDALKLLQAKFPD